MVSGNGFGHLSSAPAEFDRRGMTALMHASWLGYERSVRVLVEHGADINLADNDGATALMHA